jgi:hypothetical protein
MGEKVAAFLGFSDFVWLGIPWDLDFGPWDLQDIRSSLVAFFDRGI